MTTIIENHATAPTEGPAMMSGAEVIATLLQEAGVEVVFGYPGTSELALCDAVSSSAIRFENSRGDKEAAFLAAGASLLRPNRGCAILHGARGATNALGGIADANRNEAGTVYLLGLPSSSSAAYLPPHGEPGLVERIGSFTKWAHEVPGPAACPDARVRGRNLITAIRTALAESATPPHRPALVGIPQDILEARTVPTDLLTEDPQLPPAPTTLEDGRALDLAADRLQQARRPVILVDDYALREAGSEGAIAALSEAVRAPVFQLRYRRGPMLFQRLDRTTVPLFAGWLNQFSPRHVETLAKADLVITVEDRNMYERVIGPLPDCEYITVTSDPGKARKNDYLHDGDQILQGNISDTLSELTLRVTPSAAPDDLAHEVEDLFKVSTDSPEVADEYIATNRRRLVTALFGNVGHNGQGGVLVDDSQMFGGLIADSYDVLERGLTVFGGHGGFVGGGLPTALGLAAANPEVRVMCSLGDQAFTNSFQALAFARQSSVPLSIVICNNGRSVSLTKQGNASLGPDEREYLDNVTPIAYDRVCRSLGVDAVAVDYDPREDSPDVEAIRAWATQPGDGPRALVLNLPSDPECWRGIWITQGFEVK